MTTTIESAGPGREVAEMNETHILPPLLGDGEGKYRILVLGNSGSGKSTTARVLSMILSVPFISIDELHWGPNWYQAPAAELIEKVQKAMDDTDGSWIAEGDYMHKLNSYVVDRATDVIWLDPPLMLYLPRIFTRTIARILGFAPPCAPGCPESVREAFFSKDSILWWCLSHHWSNRRRNEERMRWIGDRKSVV